MILFGSLGGKPQNNNERIAVVRFILTLRLQINPTKMPFAYIDKTDRKKHFTFISEPDGRLENRIDSILNGYVNTDRDRQSETQPFSGCGSEIEMF